MSLFLFKHLDMVQLLPPRKSTNMSYGPALADLMEVFWSVWCRNPKAAQQMSRPWPEDAGGITFES